MFEFCFSGLFNSQNPDGKPFAYKGETTDFLEVLCQIAQHYGTGAAGEIVKALLEEHEKELFCLRVIEWNFSMSFGADEKFKETVEIRKVA